MTYTRWAVALTTGAASIYLCLTAGLNPGQVAFGFALFVIAVIATNPWHSPSRGGGSRISVRTYQAQAGDLSQLDVWDGLGGAKYAAPRKTP